jgi:hypothetical protein
MIGRTAGLVVAAFATLLPVRGRALEAGAAGSADADAAARKPRLAAPGTEREYPDFIRRDIDLAVEVYDNDPVSSCLLLKQTRDRLVGVGASQEQTAWIANSLSVVRLYVISLLERDKAAAVRADDVRGALFAAWTLARVRDQASDRQLAQDLAEPVALLRRRPEGKTAPDPVWEVLGAAGEFLPGPLVETFDPQQDEKMTISPRPGERLLRVRARIRNISARGDPLYARWTAGERPSGWDPAVDWWRNDDPRREGNAPCRFMGYSAVFLLPGTNDIVACYHVCRPCEVLWGKSGQADFGVARLSAAFRPGASRVNVLACCSGSNVGRGTAFDLDVVFSVAFPLRGDPRLLILGAAPVPVRLEGAGR